MKHFQITYHDDESLCRELETIRQCCGRNPSCTALFRIYSDDMEIEHIRHVCDILDREMPEALYLGCTTHANLLNGVLEKTNIILTCTVFEYETTKVQILQCPFLERHVKDTVDTLKAFCDANPWVKCVEMTADMLGMSVREFCEGMSTLPDDIQIFGGGAYNPKMDDTRTLVFSKGNGFSDKSIVFLLLGGEDFHVYSTYISGWKPLTRQFRVTRSHRATLYELDGEPAFNVYQKYLNIRKNTENIIANTLEFPLFMDYKGLDVLRCALGLNEDGALMMATEVPEDSNVRIAYGNPEMILSSIRDEGQTIAEFRPDVVQAFSCAARKAFWGDDNISDETSLINGIAPTSGLYVSGEFMRIGGEVRNFNITLVLAAMREGEPKGGRIANLYDTRFDSIENEERIPLVRRFVSFIEATTKELEEANRKLALTSITDGLTGLYNRAEIERGIRTCLDIHKNGVLSLIMLDLDDFKMVNDTYGHAEGDQVIIALSDVLRNELNEMGAAYIGRWGGEEFMVLLPGVGLEDAAVYAERIRESFAAVTYKKAPRQTVSLGVVQARDSETADAICSRVDKGLYAAKANGKNQVVVA